MLNRFINKVVFSASKWHLFSCLFSILWLIQAQASIASQDFHTNLSYEELNKKVEELYYNANYKDAANMAKVGREKARLEFGMQDTTYSKFTGHLALLYQVLGNYEEAEKLYKQTIEIEESLKGKMQEGYAILLNNLASLYEATGRFQESKSIYLKSLSIKEKVNGKESIDYATTLHNLGYLSQTLGHYEQTESYYEESIRIVEKVQGKYNIDYAIILHNYARLFQVMEHNEQAILLYKEVLILYDSLIGKQHPYYASTLSNLALIYQYTSNFEQAEKLYLASLAIYEKSNNTINSGYASLLNNLAGLYKSKKMYEQALDLYRRGLAIDEKLIGKLHPEYIVYLKNIGQVFQQMGQFENGLRVYREILDINEQKKVKNHLYYIRSLVDLIKLYQHTSQIDLAWEYAHESVGIIVQLPIHHEINPSWAEQILNAHFITIQHQLELVRALTYMYDLFKEINDVNKLQKKSIIASLVIELLKKAKNSFSNDEDKLRIIKESHNWMQRSLTLFDLDRDINKAFEVSELHKSVLLMEATNSTKAYQLVQLPDSVMNKEQEIQDKKAELEANLLSNIDKNQKDSLTVILNKVNLESISFKKFINAAYPKYAALKYQTNITSIASIQQTLDDRSALIEYVLGDSAIHIFCITRKHSRLISKPISIENFNDHLRKLREIVSNFSLLNENNNQTYQEYVEHAHWCYQQLITPILENVTGMAHLIIIPDGLLHHLPFESILTKGPPFEQSSYASLPYLIHDYSISYQQSATLWMNNKNDIQPDHNNQILAMAANYTNKLDDLSTYNRYPAHTRLRSNLSALPSARIEVSDLAQEFKGFFGFDSLATERVFKEKAGNYGIIHLAMHGLLNEKFPTLSSLAFTEDHDSLENNFLQAYEVAKMELNAELVVLSACQTGYGKFEKGNGTASLARAFMYAGVPSLVVSLWQIEDAATAQIMRQFYLYLSDGLDKAEALRKAKLDYIKSAKGIKGHPAFWSPIIQVGNHDAISLERKLHWQWWVGGTILIIIVLTSFLVKKH